MIWIGSLKKLTSFSGPGANRTLRLTDDTKNSGSNHCVCKFLFIKGFQYFILRELQTDHIVNFQCTGSRQEQMLMVTTDVICAFQKRLTRYARSHLEYFEQDTNTRWKISIYLRSYLEKSKLFPESFSFFRKIKTLPSYLWTISRKYKLFPSYLWAILKKSKLTIIILF